MSFSDPPVGAPGPQRQSEELRSELREFLAQAAVSLVLEGSGPPKPAEQTPTPSPVLPLRGKRTPVTRRPASLSALLLVAASALALVRWWPEPVELPEALRGHWITTNPSFAGRALIIEPRSLGFRVGPGEPEQHFTVATRRITARGDAQDVRIEYDTPEGRFTLILSRSPDGVRLANRSEVLWVRDTVSNTP